MINLTGEQIEQLQIAIQEHAKKQVEQRVKEFDHNTGCLSG